MMRIVICDDEPQFLEVERKIIDEYLLSLGISSWINVFDSAESFHKQICNYSDYDLIILDVEMPEIDGLEIASIIREYNQDICIAFVSAHIDYSLSGYKVNASRYILKNMNSIEMYLRECIDFVLTRKKDVDREITLNFSIGSRTVKIDDIVCLQSRINNVEFCRLDDRHKERLLLRSSLKRIVERMSVFDFVQINAKQAVNLKYVHNVSRYVAVLNNGERMPISQKKYNDFYRAFMLYVGRKL